MKLIHCADLHLNAKLSSNFTKEEARERRAELLHTFCSMVDFAALNEVRVILIAGDLFDTAVVSANLSHTVLAQITSHPEIDFLYLRGNHDKDNFLTDLDRLPDNLKLFSDHWTSYFYQDGRIQICGAELSANNNLILPESLELVEGACHIVTLHGQVAGYGNKTDGETIPLDAYRNRGIDYMALGHIHSYSCDRLDARGVYCYSGCLEGRGFDECGPKGFVLLDIHEASRQISARFLPRAARTLYQVEVDVSGSRDTAEAAQRIEQELGQRNLAKSSLVKLILTGQIRAESEWNPDFLMELFGDYFYCLKVEDRTQMLVDYQAYAKDHSLKGEFVRTVLASDLPEDQKTKVIRCGILALAGEEVL